MPRPLLALVLVGCPKSPPLTTIEAPTPVASAASTRPEVYEPGDEEN